VRAAHRLLVFSNQNMNNKEHREQPPTPTELNGFVFSKLPIRPSLASLRKPSVPTFATSQTRFVLWKAMGSFFPIAYPPIIGFVAQTTVRRQLSQSPKPTPSAIRPLEGNGFVFSKRLNPRELGSLRKTAVFEKLVSQKTPFLRLLSQNPYSSFVFSTHTPATLGFEAQYASRTTSKTGGAPVSRT
jgi:hypothetical protein